VCVCFVYAGRKQDEDEWSALSKADGRKNWCKARGGAFESAPGPPFSLIIAPVVAAAAGAPARSLVPSINLRRRQMTGSTFCVCTVRKGVCRGRERASERSHPVRAAPHLRFYSDSRRPIATMATHLQLVRPAKKRARVTPHDFNLCLLH
jgi:hypothetical protein